MKTDEKNPDDWLFLAHERLQAADALFQSLGATYSGVELLQEAVERFLKAYLISRGWELQKIHNLSTLLDHAVSIDERFKSQPSSFHFPVAASTTPTSDFTFPLSSFSSQASAIRFQFFYLLSSKSE